jgi:sulfatase modifying factor 1
VTQRDAGLCAGLRQICGGGDGWQPPDFGAVEGFEAGESSCDGVDNDCDGTTDETTSAPDCPFNTGVCVDGAPPPECLGAAGFAGCDYGPQYEVEEQSTCDAIDNDCDGVIDEGPACPVFFQAIRVAAGALQMGSPLDEVNRENDEQPHQVELTRDLLVRRTEVVQEEWISLMDGANPSFHLGADRPVEQVSWVDAARFCNARSALDGLAPCYALEGDAVSWPDGLDCEGWRLPTEAEWEFLGRAGTLGSHWGLDADPALAIADIAWHRANADSTRPVAQLAVAPNGLYDMLGNVAEWTYDAYVAYPVQAQVDPVAHDGVARVARGASFASLQRRVRVANRADFEIASRLRDLGLRMVRTAPVE